MSLPSQLIQFFILSGAGGGGGGGALDFIYSKMMMSMCSSLNMRCVYVSCLWMYVWCVSKGRFYTINVFIDQTE